jgi:class 3 adenylate cyclase
VLGVDFSGSTFVAVSGHDDHPNHSELILRAATAMLAVAASTTHVDGSPLAVRLGIHTGPLTTGGAVQGWAGNSMAVCAVGVIGGGDGSCCLLR